MQAPRAVHAEGPAPILSTFTFAPTSSLCLSMRVITQDGAPWFLAKDVCNVLGLETGNVRRSLPERHVKSLNLSGLRGRDPLIVSESGLYRLVLRSSKPEAERFQDWVVDEVLPTIRKQGAYVKGASNLSPEAQDALYAAIRVLLTEALRRYDKETEHVHWRSAARKPEWFRLSAENVARGMGLPLDVVVSAGAHGVDAGLSAMLKAGR